MAPIRFRLNPTKLRFFPFAAPAEDAQPLSVKWNVMRVERLHRVEVSVRNDSENIVTDVRVSLTVPDSLEFIGPTRETARLGIIKPGETMSAIFNLKPRANVEAPLMGHVIYVDHRGRPKALEISPLKHYFDADVSSVEVEPRVTPTESVPHVIVNVGDQVKEKPIYQDSVIIDKKSVTSINQGEEKPTCPNCQEPVDRRWKICPYCQAQLKQAETRRQK